MFVNSGTIIVNGEKILIPSELNENNVKLISREVKVDGKVTAYINCIFVDGREYINGEWKVTLKALWHKFF